jgi:hypothetical protein
VNMVMNLRVPETAGSSWETAQLAASQEGLRSMSEWVSDTQSVGLLRRGISLSQGRYLHTEQHKHRINAHRYPCLEWDSIPAFERTKTVLALVCASTVIVRCDNHTQNIKMDLKEIRWSGVYWVQLQRDRAQSADLSEHGNECTGAVKWGAIWWLVQRLLFLKELGSI